MFAAIIQQLAGRNGAPEAFFSGTQYRTTSFTHARAMVAQPRGPCRKSSAGLPQGGTSFKYKGLASLMEPETCCGGFATLRHCCHRRWRLRSPRALQEAKTAHLLGAIRGRYFPFFDSLMLSGACRS
jgi:hypothetical protein